MCPKILGNEASETPPPSIQSTYVSMPMKIGVAFFRIFQSASSLRGAGIRYPEENYEIDIFLLYNGEKDITFILIINTYFITEHMKKKSEINSFS